MNIACSTLVCTLDQNPKIDGAFRKIAGLGFKAVDIALFNGWQHIDPSEIAEHPKAWAQRIGNGMKTAGLVPVSINTGMSVSLSHDGQGIFDVYLAEFKAVAALARSIGCPNVTINPGSPADGETEDSVLEILRERLPVLADIGRHADITVSLEGHEGCVLEDPRKAVDFIAGFWPGVGYTYDPSHMIMQDYDPFDHLKLLEYAHHVHVRNAASGAMQAGMDDGALDVRRFFDVLRQRGYGGAIGVEYFNNFDPEYENTLMIKSIADSMQEN